jgi:hypothetical protein
MLPFARKAIIEIWRSVVSSRAGRPRHKEPSSIVVRASRPHGADSGHQILWSNTRIPHEAHVVLIPMEMRRIPFLLR